MPYFPSNHTAFVLYYFILTNLLAQKKPHHMNFLYKWYIYQGTNQLYHKNINILKTPKKDSITYSEKKVIKKVITPLDNWECWLIGYTPFLFHLTVTQLRHFQNPVRLCACQVDLLTSAHAHTRPKGCIACAYIYASVSTKCCVALSDRP